MFKIDNDILSWHKKTFPDVKLEGMLLKLDEELGELVEAIKKEDEAEELKETADLYIVARILNDRFNSYIGAFFLGMIHNSEVKNLEQAVEKKMEINRKRKWNIKNGVYKHEEEKKE